MGDLGQKTLLITGATGFIGQHLVSIALQRGHRVRVIVRDATKIPPSWHDHADLQIVHADLAASTHFTAVVEAVVGSDAVIHAAGALKGNDADHEVQTQQPLDAILAALREPTSRCAALVLASSFSVYGIAQQVPGSVVTEETPTELAPHSRDAYCRAKLVAEQRARSMCKELGIGLAIVRPGAVYGPGKLWNAHLGVRLGRGGVLLARQGEVPLCHVSHCGDVLVRAAERLIEVTVMDESVVLYRVYNAVDSQLPSRLDYALKLKDAGRLSWIIDLTWMPLRGVARSLRGLGRHLSLPGLLRLETLAYRLQPMRFSNAKIRKELDWQQSIELDELLKTAAENTTSGAHL